MPIVENDAADVAVLRLISDPSALSSHKITRAPGLDVLQIASPTSIIRHTPIGQRHLVPRPDDILAPFLWLVVGGADNHFSTVVPREAFDLAGFSTDAASFAASLEGEAEKTRSKASASRTLSTSSL